MIIAMVGLLEETGAKVLIIQDQQMKMTDKQTMSTGRRTNSLLLKWMHTSTSCSSMTGKQREIEGEMDRQTETYTDMKVEMTVSVYHPLTV